MNQSEARPQRIFYGWYIVAAAFLVVTVGHGLQHSFGIFLKPLSQGFEWSRSLTAGAFMLYLVCRALSTFVMGGLSDRYGPRVIVGVGGLLMGLGMLLGAIMTSVWQLYLFYGVLVGVGMGVGSVPLSATVSRWFIAKRGLTLGVVAAGAGVANLVISPVAGYLVNSSGIGLAYLIMGAFSLVLIMVSALVLRKEPRDLGLEPYGVREGTGTSSLRGHNGMLREAAPDWETSQAFRSRPFWVLATVSLLFGVSSYLVMTNIVAHATDLGISESRAPYLLSIVGGSNVLGVIAMGIASERIGSQRGLALCLAVQGLGVFWLTGVSSFAHLCVIAALFGFGYGGVIQQLLGITAEFFGLKSLGAILGFVWLVQILGGAAGSEIGNLVYDFTRPHSYLPAFWAVGGMYLAATALALIMRKPHLK